MLIGVISLFPEMFQAITNYGITRKAIKNNLLKIFFWNPREYSGNKRKSVDEKPYGPGPGMLIMAKPISASIRSAKFKIGEDSKVIYLSPQGKKLCQTKIDQLINNKKIILVCGRYEGIDERIILSKIDEEWSIGDYILSGGELPAMVMIDVISRCIPGVLNKKESYEQESFINNGLLDFPNYTRPRVFNGMKVPDVLLSGNHMQINRWRKKQSLGRTFLKRPKIFRNFSLSNEEKILLKEFIYENNMNCLNKKI